MFPTDNAWNREVSSDPVDPHSADYLAFKAYSGRDTRYITECLR